MSMRVADSQSYLTDAERGGCWSKKSGLEQKLIIFSAFLGAVCLGLIIGLAVVVGKTDPDSGTTTTVVSPTANPSSTVPPDLCDSPQCEITANFYTGNMDLSIDPCDDFYGFVCGKWDNKTEIPEDKSNWGVFNELRVNLAKNCIGELKEVVNDETPRDAFYNARMMFQTCKETEAVSKATAVGQLRSLLQEVTGETTVISLNETQVQPSTNATTVMPSEGSSKPTGPPNTDPTAPPNTDPTAPPNTDPTTPPNTDPTAPPNTGPTTPPNAGPTTPPNAGPTTPPNAGPTTPPNADPTTPPNADPTTPPNADPTTPTNADPTTPPKTDPTTPSPTPPVKKNSNSANQRFKRQVLDAEKSWTDIMTTVSNKFGLSFIVTIQIGADISNTTENIIYIDQQSSFPVGRLTLKANETTETDSDRRKMEAYKNYITASACFLDESFCADKIGTAQIEAIQGIIDFEKFLAANTRDPVERRDASSWYVPMTIKELQTELSGAILPNEFKVLELIRANLEGSSATVNEETIVIVKELDYLKKVLARMDEYTEEAKNYMRIRTVQSIGPYLSKEFRELEFEFDKVVSGVTSQTSIEEMCFDLVNGHFDHVVGRLYVEKVNFTETTKKDLDGMVKNLAKAFRVLVDNNDWMDDATKEAARLKLDVMNDKIGFPDWTMDDEKLNEYYQMNNLSKNSYENIKEVYAYSVQKILEKLTKTNDRDADWVSSASIVNAFYSPSANGITFPAGILQVPFYQEKRLKALNYGAIGYVIGHEITHGYDDQGRQYDANGNFNNWWTNETLNQFNEKKQCFIDQYSAITDKLTGLNLKGDQYIGENIADNGGIRESYEAYINYDREVARLPGLERFDDRQLFFIGAGSVWCTKFRKEALEQQIKYGVHSPGMYRATVPLKNTEQFAEVFKCEKGSAMNPDKRCQIW